MAVQSGIDVSSYQGLPDWSAVRASGKRFAAAKATENANFRDPTLAHNWPSMRKAGLHRLAYHFLHTTSSGADQARFFDAYVRACGGWHTPTDAVLLDLEDYGIEGQTGSVVQYIVDDFIRTCRQLNGRQICLYTGRYVLQAIGGSTALMRSCPIWAAEYGVFKPTPIPGWDVISFWQYTDHEGNAGVNGYVDHDLFFGTAAQLTAVLRPPHHSGGSAHHARQH